VDVGQAGVVAPATLTITIVFVRPYPHIQQAYVKASNTGADDDVGSRRRDLGDTDGRGCPRRDQRRDGRERRPVEQTGAQWSGAAYVFVRSGTTVTSRPTSRPRTRRPTISSARASRSRATRSSWAPPARTVAAGDRRERGPIEQAGPPKSAAAYVFVRSEDHVDPGRPTSRHRTREADTSSVRAVRDLGHTVGRRGPLPRDSAGRADGDELSTGRTASGAAYVFVPAAPRGPAGLPQASNTGPMDRSVTVVAISLATRSSVEPPTRTAPRRA